ncbi:MAG: ROK family protein [Verrucomicrobia bacterium]|jgi:glucokinase|nr:ROK family protein [Verrucomicrobiota bacterium]MBT7068640.1 ROK family protein [Verrucomicrobiota bacterium]MBT7701022.1 ROK family protein [Verrucomicrobiota bacterium]
MNPCFVGVDFGKTNVRFGVAEDEPVLACYTKQPYTRGTPAEIMRQIIDGLDRALSKAGGSRNTLRGIGISVPAVVDRETGVIAWGPDWDFMAGASLTQPIAEHYGIPVVADVDTVIPTWGENWAGIGRTCKRFAVLAWGTGLGAGLVIDGEVQEYPNNLFPEFGHSRVSDDDWPCKCGAIGCVDTMVCGGGIAKHGRLAVETGEQTVLRELCGGDPETVTSHMVFDAADRGDAVAQAILDRIAVLLGRLCANVVLTMQPEKIVFVGGLAKRSPRLLAKINATMNEGCWLLQKGLTGCEVVCSELGDRAGVLGAIRRVQMKLENRSG